MQSRVARGLGHVRPHHRRLRKPARSRGDRAAHHRRPLRAFDGIQRSAQDYDSDGNPDLAGDFDGDGTPDLGGPNVAISSAGNSFGGVLAMVHGAVDPNVTATAPISGGGGLNDVATRSALVPDSVLEQIFTPLVVAVPAKTVAKIDDIAQTQCAPEDRSVRFVVNDLTVSREIETACLPAAQLDLGKTVVLENIRNRERRCARTSLEGRFRTPIPADIGDLLDVQIYDAPDAVVSYEGCEVLPDAPIGRRIDTHSLEGIARLDRRRSGAACKVNYTPSAVCLTPPASGECAHAIADADWLAEGANAWDAPHPAVPLRLARLADVRATNASLARVWAPRLSGVPFSPDASGWRGREPLLGVLDARIQPGGQHVFVNGDPCKIFDDVVYHDGLVARFLATQGTDLYALSHPTTHRCLERETCTFE